MAASRTIHLASLAMASAAALSVSAFAVIIRVDASATGTETGATWANAMTHPQDAIDAWQPGDEIWVAATAGGYKPTHETGGGSRSATFLIGEDQNGIKIYGGFLGLAYGGGGESLFNQRNPEVNETVLSGDLGDPGDPDDNAYTVVTAEFVGPTTILDGFTITAGVGEGFAQSGGMVCANSTLTVVRCRFVRNQADEGGAVVLYVIDDLLEDQATFTNCQFLGNSASDCGGAVLVTFAAPDPVFTNCSFVGNVAYVAGAVAIQEHRNASFINCTFVSNVATYTEGPAGGAIRINDPHGDASELFNCILWGNEPDQIALTENCTAIVCPPPQVSYSDVEGGLPTEFDAGNNIDEDPLFVGNPEDGADNEWGTNDDDYGDLHLQSTSPCIDEADNASLPADFGDLNTNTNFSERTPRDLDVVRKRVLEWTSGFIVDMGAYEFGCNENLDASNDCEIDGLDLAVLLAAWTGSGTYGSCPPYVQADLDEDCQINGDDLTILLAAYGKCDACDAEEFSGPQGEDPWYEQFLEWLAEQDWAAFLQWFAEQFG